MLCKRQSETSINNKYFYGIDIVHQTCFVQSVMADCVASVCVVVAVFPDRIVS